MDGWRQRRARTPAFYVPVKLNPELIPPEKWLFAAYFLNLLHWKWITWRADANGFIRLKWEYLTRVLPRPIWPELRTQLVALGVIEVDGHFHFRAGGDHPKCMGYRLMPDYRKTKRILCTDESLARKIRAVYASDSAVHLPVQRWLNEKLDLLQFDMDMAQTIVAKMEPNADSEISVTDYQKLLTEACKRIANGDHWLHCDRFGRVHTPITSLPKGLRSCLRIDGHRLVGLDLANSQPLIAGLVASQFHGSKATQARLRQRIFRAGANPYHCRKPRPAGRAANRPDLQRYMELCEAGQLYESLMSPDDDRDRIKRCFLTAMYGKNHWEDRLKKRLTSQYPSVAGMLWSLKAKTTDTRLM